MQAVPKTQQESRPMNSTILGGRKQKLQSFHMLPRCQDGLIPTLNKNGYMIASPVALSRKFINYAEKVKGPVLDIGTAYGSVAIEALKKGAKVIANDLDRRHLQILMHQTPIALRENLSIIEGKFPDNIQLPFSSLKAVHALGVLHYLTGQEMKEAFKKIYMLLEKGGKFFFWTSTPYIAMFREYLPTYITRKEKGDEWPGFIDNTWLYAPHRKNHIPKTINLLDEDILINLFKECGFQIDEIEYQPMTGYPEDFQDNGREFIGIIATR